MSYKLLCFVFLIFVSAYVSAQVNTEVMRKGDDGFSLGLKSLLSYQSGNTDKFSVSGGANIGYVGDFWYGFMAGNIGYSETSSVKDTWKGFGHVRGGRKLFTDWFSVELFAQKEFDEFLSLNDRNLLGGSLRFYSSLVDGIGLDLYLGLGLMMENETFDYSSIGESDEGTTILRSTNYLSISWKLNETLLFASTLYYQPAPEYFHNYRILLNSNLDVKIFKCFSFTTAVNFRYDNEPPVTVAEKYDVELNYGIKFNI